MDQDLGFLNDTSLLKTPKSPLKTSTALRPNLRRGGKILPKQNGMDVSYDNFEGLSFPTLNEVTNIPSTAAPLKMKFNESALTEDRNSSLGILQMENISDFTDTSLGSTTLFPEKKTKSKKTSKSRNLKKEKSSISKQITPANDTVLRSQEADVNHNGESSDSSDIEYDGTNIPELNLDYDPISLHKEPESFVSKNMFSEEIGAKDRTQSFAATMSKTASCLSNMSSQSSVEEYRGSMTTTKPSLRDSIFENFDPAYDSIFKTLKPSGMSDINSIDMSEIKRSALLNFKSLEIESILKNDSLAELHFMKNLENLDRNSSVKFSSDEISGRSSSFRSSGASKNASQTSTSSSVAQAQSKNVSNAEDLKDDAPNSSFLGSSLGKSDTYNFTASFMAKSSTTALSEYSSKANTFVKSEGDVTSNSDAQGMEEFEYPCNLNFKDTSVFATADVYEQNNFEVSESDFVSPGEAIEIFKKDEEALNEERRFEIGNDTKGSIFSTTSSLSCNDISAPSWFLENNENPDQRISIGTLISARTECLGRLSQDSKRERPFFGIPVSTPIKELAEDSSSSFLTQSMDSNYQSASIESTPVTTHQELSATYCETPKMHFESNFFGNNESAPRDVLQNYSPMNENEVIRGSALSQLLNEMSTNQPLQLASKILQSRQPKTDRGTNSTPLPSGSKRNVGTSTNVTLESDKLDSTLTRSSSEDSLGDTLTETPKNRNDDGPLGVCCSESDDGDGQKSYGCRNCGGSQQKAPYICSRPQSSCSSVCSNPMLVQNGLQAQYGCMKYFSSSQEHCHQNAFSSCGSVGRSDAGSHGCQSRNPCGQDVLRMQMIGVGPQQGFQQMVPADCGQFPYSMQGFVYSYPALQGPSELIFPEKLSVGDSQSISLTVQNLHNMHFYHVSFVSAFINGEPVSLEIAGVNFPGMVPRSSNSSTDIQITLSPKYEGSIVVTLQVIASFNPANITLSALSSLSLQTKIKYESLRPCVSISSRGQSSLNLGKVIAGSTVLEHVTISNRCDATVPLYITLSNDSEDNHISFGLNHMKCHKYPATSGWKMISPKIMRYRLPSSKEETLESHLNIPIVIEAGNQDAVVNFTLTAAVESFSVRETLGLFRISANVGIAKLVLADARQKHQLLFAKNGSCSSRSLTLKHKGSFPVVYDLMVVEDTQSFSVSPSFLNMQPMQSSTVTISFSPTSNEVVEGVLQAAAQPHGKIFSLAEIIGDVKEAARKPGPSRSSVVPDVRPEKRPKEAKVSKQGNIIECNKKYLCWGGIDVGNTVIKTFSIRNSSNKSLKAKLFIKEKSRRFKLLNEHNEQSTSLIIGLNAKEQRTVSVSFTPTKVEPSSGFLIIKPELEKETKIFSMPLSGYGGTGKLKVTQISEKEGIGSCLDIVLPTERRPVFNSIIVHNAGCRAIFVKALFTPVISSDNSTSDVQVSINPSEFVLCEKENKTLYISYTSSGIYEEGGVITLLHGDEVLRQQMRRSRNEPCSSGQSDVTRSVNFDVHYVGEEKIMYDPLYQCIPKISSIFYLNVKKYLIHLNIVEENASYSHMTFDVLSTLENSFPEFTMNSTAYYSRRLTAASNIGHSPPVKDFTVDMLNRLSLPLERSFMEDLISQGDLSEANDLNGTACSTTEGWIVKPEVLNIDHSNKDNRILLVNNERHDLRFKVETAIDVISISPVSGIIPKKGEIGLRITIIPNNYSKLSDDYKGYVKVICGGLEKSVLINVLKDQRKTNYLSESNVVLEDHLQSVLEEDSFTDRAENTIISQPSEFIKNICDFPKEITLTTTVPGKVSETLLTVHNFEKVAVHWEIRPISVLFAESLDDSLCPTQVLQIKPSSGTLKSLEVSSIVIKFMPSRPDSYSRFFELSTTLENGTEQKCNFKVHGKASFCLTESASKPQNDGVKKISKENVYIENDSCEFPITMLGQSSTVYVKVKNPTAHDVKLNVIKPHLPFIVSQSSVVVKSKNFLKIPVNFKPTKVSKVYEDILVLHSEDGHQLMFKMKATCNEVKK